MALDPFSDYHHKQRKKLNILREQFEKFLIEYNTMEAFRNNLPDGGLNEYFNNSKHITQPLRLINSAFTWSETPQGHKYWANIENEWEIYSL